VCCTDSSCGTTSTPTLDGASALHHAFSGDGPGTSVLTCQTSVARVEFVSDSCGSERGFRFAYASDVAYTSTAALGGMEYCGDGVKQVFEECDVEHQGCKACRLQEGYTGCDSSTCILQCGDGVLAASEACDDGNLLDGDGCSSACQCEGAVCDYSVGPSDDLTSILANAAAGTTIRLLPGKYNDTLRHRHLVIQSDGVSVVGAGNTTGGTEFSTGLHHTLLVQGSGVSWSGTRHSSIFHVTVSHGSSFEIKGVALESISIAANHSSVSLHDFSAARAYRDVSFSLALDGVGSQFEARRFSVVDPVDSARVVISGSGSSFTFFSAHVSGISTAGQCIASTATDSAVSILNSTVEQCWANLFVNRPDKNGRGGGFSQTGDRTNVSVADVLFANHGCDVEGSAMALSSSNAVFTLLRIQVEGSVSYGDSAIGLTGVKSTVVMSESVIKSNLNIGAPGVVKIATAGGGSTLSQNVFEGNTGCSVEFKDNTGSLTVSRCTFLRNSAQSGAGVCSKGASIVIRDSLFKDNDAAFGGGGIFYEGSMGKLDVQGCTFDGNRAGRGAGLFARNCRVAVRNSTFSGGKATDYGGGAAFQDVLETLAISNITFLGNEANTGGGISIISDSNLATRRTVFQGPQPGILIQMSKDGSKIYQRGTGVSPAVIHIALNSHSDPHPSILSSVIVIVSRFRSTRSEIWAVKDGQSRISNSRNFSSPSQALSGKDLWVTDRETGETKKLAQVDTLADRPPLVFCVSSDETVIIVFWQMKNRLEAWQLDGSHPSLSMPVLDSALGTFWTQGELQEDSNLLVPGVAAGNTNRETWNGFGLSNAVGTDRLYVSTFWTTKAFDLRVKQFVNLTGSCFERITAMALSDDQKVLYLAQSDGDTVIWVYDVEAASCSQPWDSLPVFESVRFMTLSTDGFHLFVSTFDGAEKSDVDVTFEENEIDVMHISSGTVRRLSTVATSGNELVDLHVPMIGSIVVVDNVLYVTHFEACGTSARCSLSEIAWGVQDLRYGPFFWSTVAVTQGDMDLKSLVLYENVALDRGGGIFLSSLHVLGQANQVSGLDFVKNSASLGGGMSVDACYKNINIANVKMHNNSASNSGGGFMLSKSSHVSITDLVAHDNTCGAGGGALFFSSGLTDPGKSKVCDAMSQSKPDADGARLVVRGGSILRNTCSDGNRGTPLQGGSRRGGGHEAPTEGNVCTGAMAVAGNAHASVEDVVFEENESAYGGAFTTSVESSVLISRAAFRRNDGYFGGAILVIDASTVSLNDTVIENNIADECGGGLHVRTSKPITFSDVTIRDNYGGGDGGGICIVAEPLPLSALFGHKIVSGVVLGCDENTHTPYALNIQGGGLEMTGNTCFHGSGAIYVGCHTPTPIFRTLQAVVQEDLEATGPAEIPIRFSQNGGAYGFNIGGAFDSLSGSDQHAILKYFPGEKILTKFAMRDVFGQHIFPPPPGEDGLVDDHDTVIVRVTMSTTDNVEPSDAETLSATYVGLGEDGFFDMSSSPTPLQWPATIVGDGQDIVFPEHMYLSATARFTASNTPGYNYWKIPAVQMRFTRADCPKGHYYSRSLRVCAMCQQNQYNLRPNLDNCQQCSVGGECDGEAMVGKLISHDGSSVLKYTGEDMKWAPEIVPGLGKILRIEQCPAGYVLVRTERDHSLDQCIPCPAGTFSTEVARWEDGKGMLVARSTGTVASKCSQCEEWQKCSGGNQVGPLDIEIYTSDQGSDSRREAVQVSCLRKMSICSTVNQGDPFSFKIIDHMYATRSVNITLSVTEIDQTKSFYATRWEGTPGTYVIDYTPTRVGSHLTEVLVDGRQFAISPFFISVLPRLCPSDSGQEPNSEGICECASGSNAIGGVCVPGSTILLSVMLPAFACTIFTLWLYLHRKQKMADKLWIIEKSRLTVTGKILGSGTSGIVYEGTVGGMVVAVKAIDLTRAGANKRLATESSRRGMDFYLQKSNGMVSGDSNAKSDDHPSMGRENSVLSLRGGDHSSEWQEEVGGPSVKDEIGSAATTKNKTGNDFQSSSFSTGSKTAASLGRLRSNSTSNVLSGLNGLNGMGSISMQNRTLLEVVKTNSSTVSPMASTGNQSAGDQSVQSSVSVRSGLRSAGRGLLNTWYFVAGPVYRYLGLPDSRDLKVAYDEFVSEMRSAHQMRHPCLTAVVGAVIDDLAYPLLVSEMMELGSLYDFLQNSTIQIEPEVMKPLLHDIVQGMIYLHARDPPLIHGDLKSANVLLGTRMNAKLTDYAHKRAIVDPSGASQKSVFGTPFFLAPELIANETEQTTSSDVYAFGIQLYEIFSRKNPYEGLDPRHVLREVADRERETEFRPPQPFECPPEIWSLMKKCWNKDADERPSFVNIQSILNPMDVNNWPGANKALQGKEVLYDVFPAHVAEALIAGREVEPERKECVSLFFSDIVGFTNIVSNLDPTMVSELLNRLYTKFDRLAHQHDVFKVETIGDAYVAVTNLVKDQPDHAARMANFAKAAVEEARQTLVDENDLSKGHIKIRVGLNCGPIVANVVGTRNKRYCLFGDSMNVTSRMETASEPYRIHASREAAELIRKQDSSIPIMNRGVQNIKGKGMHRPPDAEVFRVWDLGFRA
jgi:cysteine-rich repeat protein